MNYINELPPTISQNKNNDQEYKKALIKMLPALDLENGSITQYKVEGIRIQDNSGIWLNYIKILDEPIVIDSYTKTNGEVQNSYNFFEDKTEFSRLTLDEILSRTISALGEKDIPNAVKMEYSRDEGFKKFLLSNYPDFAEKLRKL